MAKVKERVFEGSGLLECDSVCSGEWFLIVSSCLGVQQPKKQYLLGRWIA